MAQSNRKSIGVRSDLECGHNKSVENGAFVLILKCVHLCMFYALPIRSYSVTKHRQIDVSWDILKWVNAFGSDYRYYVKFGAFFKQFSVVGKHPLILSQYPQE